MRKAPWLATYRDNTGGPFRLLAVLVQWRDHACHDGSGQIMQSGYVDVKDPRQRRRMRRGERLNVERYRSRQTRNLVLITSEFCLFRGPSDGMPVTMVT